MLGKTNMGVRHHPGPWPISAYCLPNILLAYQTHELTTWLELLNVATSQNLATLTPMHKTSRHVQKKIKKHQTLGQKNYF